MSPDRSLTVVELARFITEGEEGKVKFNALETHMEENTQPSLHDLCINELIAIVHGQRKILIHQGKRINLLEKRLSELEELLSEK